MKAVIYGNLTVDKNSRNGKSFSGPGGSSFFIAKFLENISLTPTVISPRGPDFPEEILPNTSFYPGKYDQPETLVFTNEYSKNERKQSVENLEYSSLPFNNKSLTGIFKKSDIIFVTPILDNITVATVIKICTLSQNSLKVLLPQGFFRKIIKGRIINVECSKPREIANLFDIIVVSEKDCPDIERLAVILAKSGPIIIVTRAEKGASVYHKSLIRDFPAFHQEIIRDETGAGDIFAAAFAYKYYKSRSVSVSSVFANAAASLSLRFYPHELKYDQSDIEILIKANSKP